jgi:tetratricopeptide (TPR) repeat protein
LQTAKDKALYLSWFFCLLAMLFKFTALVLPVLFILTEKATAKQPQKGLTAKLPVYLFALLATVAWAVLQLKANEKTYFGVPVYNIFDSFVLIFYTIGFYIGKLLLPLSLSSFYPYPPKTGMFLAWYCYLYALLPFGLAYLTFKVRNHRWAYWGLLFFLVNSLLVSNLLPLGGRTFANDRQLYFSSIGAFVAVAYGLEYWAAKNQNLFQKLRYGLVILAMVMLVLTFLQNQTWTNGITYWDNVVATNHTHYYGYHKRGDIHSTTEATYRQSMFDLNEAVKLMPDDAEVWNSRAYIHLRIGDYIHAEEDLKNALSRNPRLFISYFHLAHVHKGYSRFDEAIKNYDLCIEHNPNYAPAYLNRGGVLYGKKEYQAALRDFNKAIELDQYYAEAYQNRGNVYYIMQDVPKALENYNICLQITPQNNEALLNRGMLKLAVGRNLDACIDIEAAKNLGNERASQLWKEHCGKKK